MRIVVLDDYQRVASGFGSWGSLDADVVFVTRERTAFDDEGLLRELPSLRLLVTTGAANASIDVPAARRLGVTVCGTRSLASPAAELT